MASNRLSIKLYYSTVPRDLWSISTSEPPEREGEGVVITHNSHGYCAVSIIFPTWLVQLVAPCKSGLSKHKDWIITFKPFRAYSAHECHETFSFMMSLPTMSLGLRFCASRKGGTGGGGWVHPKGSNSMATSGLVFRSDLVGTGRAISILFGINGVRNKRSHLVRPPFPEFKARFSATAGWHFLRLS